MIPPARPIAIYRDPCTGRLWNSHEHMYAHLEHLYRRLQNGGRQGVGRSILGAPTGLSKFLGPGSQTGDPKMPAPK
jgi:hypothetical protein